MVVVDYDDHIDDFNNSFIVVVDDTDKCDLLLIIHISFRT